MHEPYLMLSNVSFTPRFKEAPLIIHSSRPSVARIHRNMSSDNIMCRVLDDEVYGVPNDLDLPSLQEDVDNGT